MGEREKRAIASVAYTFEEEEKKKKINNSRYFHHTKKGIQIFKDLLERKWR